MSLGTNSLPGRCAGLHPPSPSSSAGGACTSAGRGQSSADVGSGSRSSLRRRAAALSRCCVVFVSFLLHSTLPAAARAAARDYSGGLLCTSRAPASLGRTVRRRQSARAPLGFRPGARLAQAQWSELAPRLRAPSLWRRGHRERSVGRSGPRRSERARPRGWPGQVVAPRRWLPSSGSVWPTRSTARISPSAATSPRPREMLLKRRRL